MSDPNLLIPFKEEDYLRQARSRYTMAFQGKEIFDRYIRLITSEVEDIQSILKQMTQDRSLDRAKGMNLDIIGEILGQPRVIMDVDFLEFFGMQGNPRSTAMGDLFSNQGGMFFDLNERLQGSVELDDETYRIILRAKVAKNTTRATPEDLMWYLNFVFGTSATFASESGATVVALISQDLTPQQVLLLSYVNRAGTYDVTLFPKPIGVGMEYGFYDPDNSFAFDEVGTAKGFGDLNDPNVDGGMLASIYQDI